MDNYTKQRINFVYNKKMKEEEEDTNALIRRLTGYADDLQKSEDRIIKSLELLKQ